MANLNSRGQLLLGNGQLSIDGRVAFPRREGQPPPPASYRIGWLNEDRAAYGSTEGICTYSYTAGRRDDALLSNSVIGFNSAFARAGKWIAYAVGYGSYGSLGYRPDDGPLGIGPDGTIGIWRKGYDGFILVSPNGTEHDVPFGGGVYNLDVLGPRTAVWSSGGHIFTTPDLTPPVYVANGGGARKLLVAGGDWVTYYTERWGMVAHPWAWPQFGLIAPNTKDRFYNSDAIVMDGAILLGGSASAGEAPTDGRVIVLHPSDARVDLTATPVVITVPALPPAPPTPPTPLPQGGAPMETPTGPFDFATVRIIGGAPDVRGWAATTRITKVDFRSDGVAVEFDAQKRWPEAPDLGAGSFQFTLWIGMFVDNAWQATGVIEFWKGRPASGDDVTKDNQIAGNWTYFAPPMNRQPQVGEAIVFFVTQGDQRRKDSHSIAERSNAVTVAFPSSLHTYLFDPAVPTTPVQPPLVPTPVTPVTPPVVPVPTVDLSPLLARIAALEASMAASEDAVRRAKLTLRRLDARKYVVEGRTASSGSSFLAHTHTYGGLVVQMVPEVMSGEEG